MEASRISLVMRCLAGMERQCLVRSAAVPAADRSPVGRLLQGQVSLRAQRLAGETPALRTLPPDFWPAEATRQRLLPLLPHIQVLDACSVGETPSRRDSLSMAAGAACARPRPASRRDANLGLPCDSCSGLGIIERIIDQHQEARSRAGFDRARTKAACRSKKTW